jgi:D-3-phosphoglycerate dehydrogenase
VTAPTDILVTLSTFGEYSDEPVRLLEASGLSFKINGSGKRMDPADVIREGGSCRGLVAGVEKYSADTLAQLPGLRCISRVGVGVDAIDLAEAKKRGVAVINTPDEPAQAVAELTLGMILGLLRRLPQLTTLTRDRAWKRMPGNLLAGKTVGLVGLGRIGRRVAGLVQAFSARVIAADPFPDQAWAKDHDVELASFDDLLERSDIVSLHASAGSTKVFIGPAQIDRMKPGAFLINMARGDMVDDNALAQALASGRLAGAGLDVFPQEPYTGPLCDQEAVILTPHEATLNHETRVQMEVKATQGLIRFLKGEDGFNRVA